MLPPQPQLSLPMPQKVTLYGAGCPFCLRICATVLVLLELTYSIHLDISSTVPLPTLAAMYGSQPSKLQSSKNSWVPKLLSSVTPPQLVFTILGRCAAGPIPSRQWYSSAKQPPGQRRLGIFISLSAATTSRRIRSCLATGSDLSTQKPP